MNPEKFLSRVLKTSRELFFCQKQPLIVLPLRVYIYYLATILIPVILHFLQNVAYLFPCLWLEFTQCGFLPSSSWRQENVERSQFINTRSENDHSHYLKMPTGPIQRKDVVLENSTLWQGLTVLNGMTKSQQRELVQEPL